VWGDHRRRGALGFLPRVVRRLGGEGHRLRCLGDRRRGLEGRRLVLGEGEGHRRVLGEGEGVGVDKVERNGQKLSEITLQMALALICQMGNGWIWLLTRIVSKVISGPEVLTSFLHEMQLVFARHGREIQVCTFKDPRN
jgi:hypothetical protein